MTNKEMIIAACAIAFFMMHSKGAKKIKAQTVVEAGMPTYDGTNWTGTMWDRLAGLDLSLFNHPNIGGGAQADPGAIGRGQALAPSSIGYDGSMLYTGPAAVQ